METTARVANLLNDLIVINNDRVAGFEKAIADVESYNADLKELFNGYASQSRKNMHDLVELAGKYGEVETGCSMSGALHRVWIDFKYLLGANDRASILNEAERGEDFIQQIYKEALTRGDLPEDAVKIVSDQAGGIHAAHDQIKALRNIANA